jgi:hypothetical protein
MKAKKQNSFAMTYLLSAFKAQADNDWSYQLAFKVVDEVMEIYKPNHNTTEVELHEKLICVKFTVVEFYSK